MCAHVRSLRDVAGDGACRTDSSMPRRAVRRRGAGGHDVRPLVSRRREPRCAARDGVVRDRRRTGVAPPADRHLPQVGRGIRSRGCFVEHADQRRRPLRLHGGRVRTGLQWPSAGAGVGAAALRPAAAGGVALLRFVAVHRAQSDRALGDRRGERRCVGRVGASSGARGRARYRRDGGGGLDPARTRATRSSLCFR